LLKKRLKLNVEKIKNTNACSVKGQALVKYYRGEAMENKSLTGREKAAYGLGAFAKDLAFMISSGYVLYYYQDILGINAYAMGIILLVARVFDAFNDPVMGMIVAKTRTRWGKFRPWLLIGTVTNAVMLILLYSAPKALSGSNLIAYAAVIYIMWGVTYTMMDIPFWSMIPAFTHSGSEREGLSTLARTCAGIGDAVITVFTVKIVSMLGGNSEAAGFSRFAVMIAAIFVVCIAITCLVIKEKSTVNVEAPSLGEMFKALFANDQAIIVVVAIVLVNLSLYITSNLLIYFFKYDFGGEGWKDSYTLFTAFGGGIQILSMMIIYPALRRFMDSIKIYYVSFGMAITGYVVLLIMMMAGFMNLYVMLVPAFLVFAAFGMLTVLTTVFLANTVDYGEYKNNTRDESVIFSMQTFVVKLASGLASMIAALCLGITKISNDTSDAAATVSASGSSLMVLRSFMTIVPIVGLCLAMFIFKKKYILSDKKLEEISKELEKRHAKG